MKKEVLEKAQERIRDNPTMAKMKAIAYTPFKLAQSLVDEAAVKKEAEAKRIRKQQRNIKNAQKHTS